MHVVKCIKIIFTTYKYIFCIEEKKKKHSSFSKMYSLSCVWITENTEVSPITNNEPAKCSMKGFVSCTDDSECPKNQKCCSTSCGGSLCMVPVTGIILYLIIL